MSSVPIPNHDSIWRIVKKSHPLETFLLTSECTICGRDPKCDIVLPFPAVCRQHFQIHCRLGGCYLEDLNSRCGTFLDQGKGCNNGLLRAVCEIQGGGWQIIGLTPLRAGDVFGHPADYLTLERTAPMTANDWTNGTNSQALLLALRGTSAAEPGRLRRFLANCQELLDETNRDEGALRRLSEHADAWTAAAGLARFVVAAATSELLRRIQSNERLRQKWDTEIWRACAEAELRVCTLLRELFDNPFGGL